MTNQEIAVEIVKLAYNSCFGSKTVEFSGCSHIRTIVIKFNKYCIDTIEYGIDEDSIEGCNEDRYGKVSPMEILNITKVASLFRSMK